MMVEGGGGREEGQPRERPQNGKHRDIEGETIHS